MFLQFHSDWIWIDFSESVHVASTRQSRLFFDLPIWSFVYSDNLSLSLVLLPSSICCFLTTCERSVIRQHPPLNPQALMWHCQAFDVWKQQQLLPQIPLSLWACQPLPHGKRSSLSIVHIYVRFKPLRSFAWSSLIYLVGKMSISVRSEREIRDVRELREQGSVATKTGIEIERGSKWGIGEGDEEKWSETDRGTNERRCAVGEKRKWILYLSHCSRRERERREGENLSVFVWLSSCNVLVLWWPVFICAILIISYCLFCPLAYCLRLAPWNSSSGTAIIQVTASDADDPTYGNSARLVYTLVQGQPHFSVDAQTGEFFFSQELFYY